MKLYTINATPARAEKLKHINDSACAEYPVLVSRLLAKYGIDGFTIYEVQGYWQGESERSFKIELALPETARTKQLVKTISEQLRDTWNQDAVMLTNPDNSVEFI